METIKRGCEPENTITNIWFEFTIAHAPIDRNDCNSDVIFELNGGSKWEATFFTYKNIETLRQKNQLSGECLNGTYFCAATMILVSEMSEEVIRAVLQEMLLSGEIEVYCHRLQ